MSKSAGTASADKILDFCLVQDVISVLGVSGELSGSSYLMLFKGFLEFEGQS